MKNSFHQISTNVSRWAGSTWAFGLAILGVLVWLVSGPYFHFSNTWLIAVTAITDVVIFIMVFSIQNTQNRDSKAIQLKLNELISADKKARDAFIGLESLTDNELSQLDDEFKKLLAKMDEPPAGINRLHKSIRQEKAKRPSFYEQAEHLVDSLLSPLNNKNQDK